MAPEWGLIVVYAQSLPPVGGALFGGVLAVSGGGAWALVPYTLLCVIAGLLLIRAHRARRWRLDHADTHNAAAPAEVRRSRREVRAGD